MIGGVPCSKLKSDRISDGFGGEGNFSAFVKGREYVRGYAKKTRRKSNVIACLLAYAYAH
jgi:hypothetical protein